jgi:HSP20 family protein
MAGASERRQGWPVPLPDLFGWVESGFPNWHNVPGLHGIRIEERMTDEAYIVRAELPGIDPDRDIEISIADGVLTIRAERTEHHEEPGDKRHSEFRYGSFARSVRLPAGAHADEATADCKDGVLAVTVPCPQAKAGATTIPVRRG